jgi:diguanylate cyclase (GGDEF)-like protein
LDSEVKTRITPLSEVAQPEGSGDDCLVIIYSPDARNFGKRQVMGNETLRVGRERGNQIVLPSDSVSRRHCRIDKRKSSWFIKDLGSTNGTYVNDELVEEYQLRRGDQIKVGDTIFKYLSGQDVEAQYHETIYRMTIMDGLTNVHNKRYLLETLERELPRALRHQRPLALCMFDLDHFKQVNDQLGHQVGDEVLKAFAAMLVSQTPHGSVARMGGEEFLVVLPGLDRLAGREEADRLRREVTAACAPALPDEWAQTASVGVAVYPSNGAFPDGLVREADRALYEAKGGGRDAVAMAPPPADDGPPR